MDSQKELVSIIVPCYNNETTIIETIESVISQTSPHWELICVDDGSQDNTVNVIKQYCEKDSRIRLFIRDTEPKGGSHCRNIGALAANGEYLVFLDGDDLLSKTCIENRLSTIEKTDYLFVVFRMAFFRGPDPVKDTFAGTHLIKGLDYLYYYASGNAGWTITSPIIKKKYFVELGGFDVSFPRLQDIEFNFRAILKSNGQYMLMYDDPYDCYYRYGGTVSSKMSLKLENALFSYEKFLRLVEQVDNTIRNVKKSFLSKAILNIYCNAFVQYDILKMKYAYSEALPVWLYEGNASRLIERKELYILKMLQMCSSLTWINYLLSRIISKVIRKSFC